MIYGSADSRCVVDYSVLQPLLSRQHVDAILTRYGFKPISIDLVNFARDYSERARYRRGVSIQKAPTIVDCSSFMKWLYAQRGIWLPRYAIQQRAYIADSIEREQLQSGDLVFASRRFGMYDTDASDRVGHVGMATDEGSIIHASQERGVCEVSLATFLKGSAWRGARRVIADQNQIQTFTISEMYNIESSDDIRWLIILHLRSRTIIPL